MTGALADAERVVAAGRHPRDAGRAEIVEGEVLPLLVAVVQLDAGHTGGLQVLSEQRSALVWLRHPEHSLAVALFVKPTQEREQVALDRNATRLAALRGLHDARRAIDGLVNVDDGVL